MTWQLGEEDEKGQMGGKVREMKGENETKGN